MNSSNSRVTHLGKALAVSLLMLLSPATWAQVAAPKPPAAEAQPEIPKDTLGRNTPRGAVLGFLTSSSTVAFLPVSTPLVKSPRAPYPIL